MTISIPDGPNQWRDITNKMEIEKAIIDTNHEKFSQSFHNPFYQPDLIQEFGFQSLTSAAQAVIGGFYVPKMETNSAVCQFLEEIQKT
jgi:hypothetical protein